MAGSEVCYQHLGTRHRQPPTPTPLTSARYHSLPLTITPAAANPYARPYDGDIPVGRTALMNIDWQVDFCGEGGYVDTMGYDLSLTRTPLGPAQTVLHAAREIGRASCRERV